MLKLPKNLLNHPRAAALAAHFEAHAAPLREGSAVLASRWEFDAGVRAMLKLASARQHLVQGLETIEAELDRELKGLRAVQEKTGQAPVARLSRLLFLANDGSPRFYRNVERLLARHGERTWACLLAADRAALGAKAYLIDDRAVLEQALVLLVETSVG